MNNININMQTHKEIAEEINEIIDRITSLSVKISNCGGKINMQSLTNMLDRSTVTISDIRFDLENLMLKDNPDAPLYTSYRNYRLESKQMTAKTCKNCNIQAYLGPLHEFDNECLECEDMDKWQPFLR